MSPDRRVSAASVSLVVGTALFFVKTFAWRLSQSTAILSDALESIANVMASAFLVAAILFARRPADRGHPYGHGKVESFSAAFEGGLITFAAVAIVWSAIEELVRGPRIVAVDAALILTGACGVANALLGIYLLRVGRRSGSQALVADGHHVLSDSWTSAGVLGGLLLVRATGVAVLDPLVALVIGLHLGWTGLGVVRRAGRELLDGEDPELLGRLVAAFEAHPVAGVIRIHHLRAIRAGVVAHVDAHVIVPEFWTIERAHEAVSELERLVLQQGGLEGEIAFHLDPCRRSLCVECDVPDCHLRRATFEARVRLTTENATGAVL